MSWSLRNKATGGQSSSGTTQASVDIAVTIGDLIVVYGTAYYVASAIEDNAAHSWTILADQVTDYSNGKNIAWYTIANSTATITITVTFGATTSYTQRYVSAAAFDPGGDTINLAASTTTAQAYTTTHTTDTISAAENDVLAIAHYNNSNRIALTSILIDSSAPDDNQVPYVGGIQYWTIYTSGAVNVDAYAQQNSNGWMILSLSLFEQIPNSRRSNCI